MPLQQNRLINLKMTLEGDDEPLELLVLKSALTVKSARDFQRGITKAGSRAARIESLNKKAGREEEKDAYDKIMAEIDELEKQPDQIEIATDFAVAAIKSWNMFKTLADKESNNPIPITRDALFELDPTLLVGIVEKIVELIAPPEGKGHRTS